MRIPGLSFSWKRALGISAARTRVTRVTGIPTTRSGIECKLGGIILNAIVGKPKRKRRK